MKYVDFWFSCERVLADKRPRINTIEKRVYPDKKREAYKDMIRKSFKNVSINHSDYCGAISLSVNVFRSLPKSRPKRIENEHDVYKPDADNIAKIIMDALNGIAWRDDSQINNLSISKKDRARREKEMCYVRIGYEELSDE